jgi:hypothetical protein
MDETTKPVRKRRWAKVMLITLGVFILVLVGAGQLSARLYQGPQTLDALMTAMPGVPLFPFAGLTANNRAQQHAMGIPLWLLRRQGASHAETAFLQVPSDPAFIREWHEGELKKAGWTLAGNEQGRLVFVKDRAILQVIIGPQRDLLTAYQLVYLDGLSKRQLDDITN